MNKLGYCIGGKFKINGKTYKGNTYDGLKAANDYLLSCGYDYMETSLGNIMSLSGKELELGAKELKIRSVNGFLPIDLYPHYPICIAYAAIACAHMKKIGITTAVFGSGRKRALNQNATIAKIESVLLKRYLIILEGFARKNGITIVIEPLNKGETNVFNTYKSAAEMANSLNLPNLKVLADSYHVAKENEPLENIINNASLLKHVHVAEPKDRLVPGREDGVYLKSFCNALKNIGYNGSITVEAKSDNLDEDIPLSLVTLRQMLN